MAEDTRPLRVLTIGPAPAGPDSRGGMASVMTLMVDHPDRRIEMTVIPTYVDGSKLRKLAVGLRGMVSASKAVLLGRTDVLHVHLAHGGSVVRKGVPLMTARLCGVPSVVHAHSYDFAGWLGGLNPVLRRVARGVLVADRWVVLGSSHVGSFAPLLHLPPERFVVLHNPVVLPGIAPLPTGEEAVRTDGPDSKVTVVSLGRLGVRKGSYDVVSAVATLPPEVRDRLHVVLAGDGEVDQVRRTVTDAGLAGVVQVRGWLDPAERDELVGDADVFLLPSYEEGLPMALLESMAQGLAPIVTPVGGIPNVVTDDREGVLVEAGDVAAIAKALQSMVEDPERRVRLRAAARLRSEDFDVSRWYAALAELWFSLARRRRG